MAKHALCVAAYGSRKTWPSRNSSALSLDIFHPIKIEEGANLGIAHQLRGMPGGFYYPGPEEVDLWEADRPRHELEIGEVDDADWEKVYNILSRVQILKDEFSKWNCHDWALTGLDELKKAGFVWEHMTEQALRTWLREPE